MPVHSAPDASTGGASADTGGSYQDAPDLRVFVMGLFFIFGGITSLNDILIPKLKELFTLSHAYAMLVQSAFFVSYFIVSLPAAAVVRRFGYLRTAVIGLLMMTGGCLLFVPASSAGTFIAFLLALFVLGAGITTVQVVANPLISMLGVPKSAHSRLTFAQAFNSLGTTIFPPIGSILILGSLANTHASDLTGAALTAYRTQATHTVVTTYLGLAAACAIVALLVWLRRNRLMEAPLESVTFRHAFNLLRDRRFGFGALCIFLYVGAEVSIGSLIVNYLEQSNVLGLGAEDAGKHVSYYWGGAMVGRFIGSALLRMFSPGKVLACAGAMNVLLLVFSTLASGPASGWSLLAIGLFNSIMFPTIFSLASEGLGPRAAEGSGIICVAIVGGAVVPRLTGVAVDWINANDLKSGLFIPAICYAIILAFGIFARRPKA
jgi:FHS family L-fucose permease-like MFS transporter